DARIRRLTESWKKAREAARVLAGTPRVLRLVFAAHPHYPVLLFSLNIVLGLVPLAEVLILKMLVDGVVQSAGNLSAHPIQADPQNWLSLAVISPILIPVTLMAIMRLLQGLIDPTQMFLEQQLGDSLSNYITTRILRKANSLVDISAFENPKFHDCLQK